MIRKIIITALVILSLMAAQAGAGAVEGAYTIPSKAELNSAAMRFIPKEDLEKEGYGKYGKLFMQK